jgi:hypothetical protein
MEAADFSGYATKAGLVCTDGRTIMEDAFKHQDKMTVPLVWQHGHNEATNILGHAVLENRPATHPEGAGVYAYGFFNDTPHGIAGKKIVQHKDISWLSIYATQLVERSKQVFHGAIREVSLVIAGANPGARIDFVSLQHSDGVVEDLQDEAIIFTGIEIKHEAAPDATLQDIYDSMDEDQKNLVAHMVATALEEAGVTHTEEPVVELTDEQKEAAAAEQAAADKKLADDKAAAEAQNSNDGNVTHTEGIQMTNVFEQGKGGVQTAERVTLSHEDKQGIMQAAMLPGQTLKTAVEAYALEHGIDNIDLLFPDAKSLTDRPEWIRRDDSWVAGVINGCRHTPFSRIKTMTADLTFEDARAKGYITGNVKKEQFFGLAKRITTPQTIYKKQRLDRDDIIDITDFDVVAWLKVEMQFMLKEELARAVLIGDGRAMDDEDKIKDPAGAPEGAGIRSILLDHELYVTNVNVNILDANSDYEEVIEEVLRARRFYKGSGRPTFYTNETTLTEMLLTKDGFERRRYADEAALAAALRVSSIVTVEVFDDVPDLIGIIVNLADYALGADRGGEISMFDDFNIDYNQYIYLIETRVSGALTKVKSALVVRRTEVGSQLIVPQAPTFNEVTGVLTVPTVSGVTYKNDDTDATLAAGAQAAIAAGATINVRAETDATRHFATNAEDQWSFTRNA